MYACINSITEEFFDLEVYQNKILPLFLSRFNKKMHVSLYFSNLTSEINKLCSVNKNLKMKKKPFVMLSVTVPTLKLFTFSDL